LQPFEELPQSRCWEAGRYLLAVRGGLLGGALGDALAYAWQQRPVEERIAASAAPASLTMVADATGKVGSSSEYTQLLLFSCEAILRGTVRSVEYQSWGTPARRDWSGLHVYVLTDMAYRRWLQTQHGDASHVSSAAKSDGAGWLLSQKLLYQTCPVGAGVSRQALRLLEADDSLQSGAVPTNSAEDACAVVRAAPFGLAPVEMPFHVAHEGARLTHSRSNSRTAAGAYAVLLQAISIERLSLPDAISKTIQSLGDHPKSKATVQALRHVVSVGGAEPMAGNALRQPPGTPAEALAFGAACAFSHTDFKTVIARSLGHAGDIVATAAIAGTIFGAIHGAGALPAPMIKRLELRRIIAAIADDIVIGYGATAAWRRRYPGY